jgi:aspartate carbamoyltransferase catalytic subunit
MNFVSPREVGLSIKTREFLKENGIDFTETENIDDVLSKTDVLYVTRVKKEFLAEELYKKIKGKYIVDKNMLTKMKKKSIIMHNLPRIDEISKEIDDDPRSVYLRSEVKNGMYVRMALLALVLGKE